MPVFYYQALDRSGRIVKGSGVFDDEHSLYVWLKSRNLALIKSRKSVFKSYFGRRVHPAELIEFSRQMFYILRSGVPILQGIEELLQSIKKQPLRNVLEAIYRDIEAGQSLSDALSSHSNVFPKFYVSIIRAGESSGNLDKAFWEIMNYMEWVEDIKNRVKQALIYPVIVSIFIGIALLIFIVFVIPKLTKFLLDLNMPLPLPTRILIGFNNFILNYWYIFLGIGTGLVIFVVFSRFSERMLYLWDKNKLKIPYIGGLFLNLIMVRFVKYMGMLYKAGIQVYPSLDIIKEIVGNRFYREKIDRIKRFLGEGESLASAIELAEDFPSLVIRSVRIGESTGNLESSFEELAKYFNDELDRAVKRITSIIEPALLALVAVVILAIVVAVLLPIYNMIGKIS